MKPEEKRVLRLLTKSYYDFQDMRKNMGNRLKIKKTKEKQKSNLTQYELDLEGIEYLTMIYEEAETKEKEIGKRIEKMVKKDGFYKVLHSKIKGVGPVIGAVIISQYDIERATTVSKLYQFSGLNPGLIRGQVRRKCKNPERYKPKKDEEVSMIGEDFVIVRTNTMIRGDKKTKGFICPYNQFLRTRLNGVLAPQFLIKTNKSPYAKVYYNLHVPEKYRTIKKEMEKRPELVGQYGRLHASEKLCNGKGMWKDESDFHKSNHARRCMIKAFLRDLYALWREYEGLPVRVPYEEEYLGKVHHKEKPRLIKRTERNKKPKVNE